MMQTCIKPTLEEREFNTRMNWKHIISQYKKVPESKIKEFEKDKLYLGSLRK